MTSRTRRGGIGDFTNVHSAPSRRTPSYPGRRLQAPPMPGPNAGQGIGGPCNSTRGGIRSTETAITSHCRIKALSHSLIQD